MAMRMKLRFGKRNDGKGRQCKAGIHNDTDTPTTSQHPPSSASTTDTLERDYTLDLSHHQSSLQQTVSLQCIATLAIANVRDSALEHFEKKSSASVAMEQGSQEASENAVWKNSYDNDDKTALDDDEKEIGAWELMTRARAATFPNGLAELPRFDSKEILVGRFLGRGGFSNVDEVRGIRLLPRDDEEPSETNFDDMQRHFLAEHCIRPSCGEARYAIKRLHKITTGDPDRLKVGLNDLATEANFLSRLQHPNIVKLRAMSLAAFDVAHAHDTFLVLDRLYDTLATRLVQWRKRTHCKSLVSRLRVRTSRALDEERLTVAYDLSAAIDYLHEQRILHRDIKPENIGFDIRGDVKIFDFGLACDLNDKVADSNGDYRLSLTGSLRYMAPEVARGDPYNESCDVYSFTLVFWEMLATERPYQRFRRHSAFVQQVFHGGYRPLIRASWSHGCKQILKGGWMDPPSKRLTMDRINFLLRVELAKVIAQEQLDDLKRFDHTQRRSTYVFPSKNMYDCNVVGRSTCKI